MSKPARDPVALRSERHLDFFNLAFTRFTRKHMRAVRVARWGMPDVPRGAPAVIFANHGTASPSCCCTGGC